MTMHTEGDLRVWFPDAADVRKFDGPDHGLTCMKAVDLIVDFGDKYAFIEFKDPQDPKAPKESAREFIERFKSGKLDNDLKYKYRDSFLYEWASGRIDKPIYFFVLIASDRLSGVDLLNRTDALRRQLPLHGPKSGSWINRIADGCIVFNIDSWNRKFPQYPIRRLSVSSDTT